MSVSANSIIHYTKTFDSLKGIISDGFKLKYCSEIVVQDAARRSGAFPMVCFCDLPLSQVKIDHLDAYGAYGIGMTKAWAQKNGLNPVLYIDKNSSIGNRIHEQGKRLVQRRKDGEKDEELLSDFIYICSFSKNYEGLLERGTYRNENYKFYNEREWRFVPDAKVLNGAKTFLPNDVYLSDKDKHNKTLEGIFLKFDYSDIAYFIVEQEEDIHPLLKILHDKYEKECKSFELDILKTRIVTARQIIDDF